MRKLISILMVLISFGAMAQDGHIIYNEHSNYKMYGRDVLVRSDATNLDTLTSVYDGSIAFDTVKNQVVVYDGSAWNPIAYGQVLTTSLSIPSASVLTLNSVPIEIISAPGSGYAIEVISASLKLDFNSVAYATNVDVVLKINGATYSLASSTLYGTVSQHISFQKRVNAGAAQTQILENQPLIVTEEVGDPTAGDSDIEIYIRYRIIEL